MKRALRVLVVGAALAVVGWSVQATAGDVNKSTHLSNGGQVAVNKSNAKMYLQSDGNDDVMDRNDTIVHMGSRKKGDCNMNVGGTQDGKNVVVTAKNIISICK